MRKFAPFFVVLTAVCLVAFQSAVGQIEKSARNSISCVSTVLVTGPSIRLDKEKTGLFLSKIREYVELPRFDRNILPPTVEQRFIQETQGKTLNMDQVAELIDEYLTPTIVQILDEYKEYRGVPEDQFPGAVVTKMKEDGLTYEDLQRVLNSAYVYVPTLSFYKKTITNDNIRFELEAGIAWFHISYKEGKGHASLYAKYQSKGSESASIQKKEKESLSAAKKRVEEKAFNDAVDELGKNLRVKTKEIFPTEAPADEVAGRTVGFRLGTNEGLNLDDKLIVYKFIEDEKTKEEIRVDVGYVRVKSVANNTKDKYALSKAKTIIGSDFYVGMMLKEHPRLGVDLAFRASRIPLNIESGNVADTLLQLPEKNEMGAYVAQFLMQTNLAPTLKISQLFFTLQFDIGAGLLDGTLLDEDVDFGWLTGIHGGLTKKFYLGRMALVAQAEYGFQKFETSKKYEEKEHSFSIDSKGATCELTLEYAISTDFNLGLGGGYKFFEKRTNWSYEIDGERRGLSGEKPEVDFSGPFATLYLTYSVPSLPSFF